MADYIFGDPHFGDEGIILMENRPFKNVKDMTECLIENINNTVDKSDRLYIDGDFCWNLKATEIERILARIHGEKVLIMGNHDQNFTEKEWMSMGFDIAINNPIILNDWYIVSHEPIYVSKAMPYFNIYAHVHGNQNYKDFSTHGACVSAERLGYKPIPLDAIYARTRELRK